MKQLVTPDGYALIGILNISVLLMLGLLVFLNSRPVEAVYNEQVAVLEKPTTQKPQKAKQGVPVRLVVSDGLIDIRVKTGSYMPSDDIWEIDDDSAFYADRTVPVNDNNGTTLIYGHGTDEIFGKVPDISAGAKAKVYTSNGFIFSYEYLGSKEVTPEDTSVLSENGPPILLLQTCSGYFDAYRTLAEFKLVGVSGGV